MSEDSESIESISEVEQTLLRGRFWTRPFMLLEENLLIQEEKLGKKLRTEALLWERDLTEILLQEIREAYQHSLPTTIILSGAPGLGKTEGGKALAAYCKNQAIKHFGRSQIYWTFGFQETVSISESIQEGDVVEQDETQRMQGMDARSIMYAISDLQEIVFRRAKITFIVSSVFAFEVRKVAHVLLKIFGGNYQTRIALFKVYSAQTGLPLGHLKVPLLDPEDPENIRHQHREAAFKAKIKHRRGYSSVKVDPKRFASDVEKLTAKIFGKTHITYQELTAYQKRMVRRYRVERLKSKLLDAEIAGSEQYQKLIQNKVWTLIQDFKDYYKDELELQKLKEKQDEQEQKAQEQEHYLQEVGRQKTEDIQELILACADFYAFKKVKPVQLRSFFTERGIYKENLDYCLAKTYDRIMELEDSPGPSMNANTQTELGEFHIELKKKVEDKHFYATLKQVLPIGLKKIKTKKLKQKHIEAWFQHYEERVTVDNLAEYYKIKSKSSFTNSYKGGGWFAIFKEELLGHLTELALTIDYYSDFRLIGGNSEPDLVHDNIFVEVKARHRRETPQLKMFNKKELTHVKSGGKLELCLVTFNPGNCIIEMYTMKVKDD